MPEVVADDGARLQVAAVGSGPLNVLFLHSMGGGIASWRPLWERLDLSRIRCLAFDFRGVGQSEKQPCELTNERLANDALLVAEHCGAESFVVVGHSMGAKLALYLAAVAASRVRALVLMGAPGPGQVPIGREFVENYLAQRDRLEATRTLFRPWFSVWPRPELDAWLASFARTPEWAIRASCEASIWTDFSAAVPPIRVPVAVMVGSDDPVYGPEYQRQAVLPYVPHAQVDTFACGHGMFLEQPDAIAHRLQGFLDGVA